MDYSCWLYSGLLRRIGISVQPGPWFKGKPATSGYCCIDKYIATEEHEDADELHYTTSVLGAGVNFSGGPFSSSAGTISIGWCGAAAEGPVHSRGYADRLPQPGQ